MSGPKQTLLCGLELPSGVRHPATATAKARPGLVPVSLGLLEVGKVQMGHQSFPTNHGAGAGAGSPRGGDVSLDDGQARCSQGGWGTAGARVAGAGAFGTTLVWICSG